MSHPDTDTIALIALGESVDPVDMEHIKQCSKCQSEFDELHSVVSTARSITDADLPVDPPESVWTAIESALVTPTPVKRGAGWYALAASVGVVIGLLIGRR